MIYVISISVSRVSIELIHNEKIDRKERGTVSCVIGLATEFSGLSFNMSTTDRSKPNILITGTPGTGKTTLAAELASRVNFKVNQGPLYLHDYISRNMLE